MEMTATSTERPAIPVRKITFPFDEQIPRHWFGGNAMQTHIFNGLNLTDPIYAMIREELHDRRGVPLASYQPKFIVNQVIASCKFDGVAPEFTVERIRDALSNLYVDDVASDSSNAHHPMAAE